MENYLFVNRWYLCNHICIYLMTLRNDPKLLYVTCALVMVMKVGDRSSCLNINMEIDNNAFWMGIDDNWGYAISNLGV